MCACRVSQVSRQFSYDTAGQACSIAAGYRGPPGPAGHKTSAAPWVPCRTRSSAAAACSSGWRAGTGTVRAPPASSPARRRARAVGTTSRSRIPGRRRVAGDGGQRAAVPDGGQRIGGAARRRVDRRVDAGRAAPGERAHLPGPAGRPVVQDLGGPEGRDPGALGGSGRRDHRRAEVHRELDQQAPGDAARPVHQHRLASPGPHPGGRQGLVGRQRRDGQGRGGRPGHRRRHDGHVGRGRDELLGPRALLAQRHRVRRDPIAHGHAGDRGPDRRDQPGGLHAQCHRRPRAGIPAPGADELVPVADPGRPDVQQHLAGPQRPRPGQVQQLDLAAGLAYSRCPHLPPLPLTALALARRYGSYPPWSSSCRRRACSGGRLAHPNAAHGPPEQAHEEDHGG